MLPALWQIFVNLGWIYSKNMFARSMIMEYAAGVLRMHSDIHHCQTPSLNSYPPNVLMRALISKDKCDPQLNSWGVAFLMHEYGETL